MKWPPHVHKSILFKPHALSFSLQPIQLFMSMDTTWILNPTFVLKIKLTWFGEEHCAWHATEVKMALLLDHILALFSVHLLWAFVFSFSLKFWTFFSRTITCIESASYLAWPPSRLFVIVSQLRLISPQRQHDTTIRFFLSLSVSLSLYLSSSSKVSVFIIVVFFFVFESVCFYVFVFLFSSSKVSISLSLCLGSSSKVSVSWSLCLSLSLKVSVSWSSCLCLSLKVSVSSFCLCLGSLWLYLNVKLMLHSYLLFLEISSHIHQCYVMR